MYDAIVKNMTHNINIRNGENRGITKITITNVNNKTSKEGKNSSI